MSVGHFFEQPFASARLAPECVLFARRSQECVSSPRC